MSCLIVSYHHTICAFESNVFPSHLPPPLSFLLATTIYLLYLQVFDEGRLSDSHGRVADFRNTVIIMTSNLGQQELREMRLSNEKQEKQNIVDESSSAHTGISGSGSRGGSGSGSASERVGEDEVDEALALHDATYTTMKNNLMNNDYSSIDSEKKSSSREKSEEKINDMTLELVNKYFSLEFVNRIDEVIMFNPLSMESVQSICRVQISKVKNLLTARGDFLIYYCNVIHFDMVHYDVFDFILFDFDVICFVTFTFVHTYVYVFVYFRAHDIIILRTLASTDWYNIL